MMKKQFLILLLHFTAFTVQAQQKIKDGTGTPATSLPAAGSLLELQSTQAGLRMPQIALTNTTTWLPLQGSGAAATSPGMSVYNTNAAITSTNANYPANGVGEYNWDGIGWINKNSSNTQNSLVLFSVKRTTTQAVTDGVWAVIDFTAKDYDKNNNYNLTTNTFTVPATAPGYYQVNGYLTSNLQVGISQGGYLGIFVNNVFRRYLSVGNAGPGAGITITGTLALPLVAGDVVSIRYLANQTGEVLNNVQIDIYQMSR